MKHKDFRDSEKFYELLSHFTAEEGITSDASYMVFSIVYPNVAGFHVGRCVFG